MWVQLGHGHLHDTELSRLDFCPSSKNIITVWVVPTLLPWPPVSKPGRSSGSDPFFSFGQGKPQQERLCTRQKPLREVM